MSKVIKSYPTSKKCSRCNVEKNLSNFNVNKKTKDGKGGWCRDCKSLQRSGYGNASEEIRRRVIEAKKIRKNKEKVKRPQANLKIIKMLRREAIAIGLDPFHCQVCGVSSDKTQICLDHCHETNTFRAFKCTRCNAGLAFLGDTVVKARANLDKQEIVHAANALIMLMNS